MKYIKEHKFAYALLAILLMVLIIFNVSTTSNAQEAERYPVIIDTDFASDGDDILALRIAMLYDTQGIIDIKGIALSTCYSRTPQGVSALLKHDGFRYVPIAMDTTKPVHVNTNYIDVMANRGGNSGYESPVKMYRRILAESPTKVNILTLGFLQNIRELMASQPDEYSPLNGMQLITEKVNNLYILGGNLTGKPSFNLYWTGDYVLSSAKIVNDGYPGNIVWLTTELGGDVWNGAFYRGNDYAKKDIATEALIANHQGAGVCSWDLMGVYAMVQDLQGTGVQNGLYKYDGFMWISDTGGTAWTQVDGYPNRQIILKANEGQYYSDILESMLWGKFSDMYLD